jgi:phage-related protein (TIGR01555 family)
VFSGMGGGNDTRRGNIYAFCPITHQQIEAAYRGSGLMRKVIDVPALDMVREWRDWEAENAAAALIEAEEERLGLQHKVLLAEIMRGLGGGALILGLPGDAAMPANMGAVGKGGLAYIHVVNRWQLALGDMVLDPLDPLFGGPTHFQITTDAKMQRIHPSRVVCFKADPIPNLTGIDTLDAFWGESRVQRLMEAVQNSDTAQTAFATLISKARNIIVGIPGLLDIASTAGGEAQLAKRMQTFALGESMYNVTLRDAGDGSNGAGETIDHRQVTWAGIPEVMDAFDQRVASVADIPMTRLAGRSPAGMNATGQHDADNWDKMVIARQKLLLRPCLRQFDDALIRSALGSRPPEITWTFASLNAPSEGDEATRFKTVMEAAQIVQNTGAVPDEAFSEAFQNTLVENGFMPGLEAALAKVPDAERFGVQQQPDPSALDPSALQAANENTVQQMVKRGAVTAKQADSLLLDASPRTLYVSRQLLNAAEFIAWAKGQGFETTTPANELHATVCFSRTPVDWMKVGSTWDGDDKGLLTVPPGGARIVEALGDKGAVVLLFASSALSWRHEEMVRNGASFDFEEYQPHVTITYQAPEGLDLSKVKPYRGKLVFGPEIFAEVVDDWEKSLVEA